MKHTSRLIYTASVLIFAAILASACGQAVEQPAASVQQPAASGQELKGNIAISGAFALYPMMTRWAEEFHKVHPGVEFDISAGGAGKGMADALAGAVDIGMVSRSVTKDEENNVVGVFHDLGPTADKEISSMTINSKCDAEF